MKVLFSHIKKDNFLYLLIFLTAIIFYPLFLKGQIPFSSNLLVSFYNPWAQEKFVGWQQGIPNKPVGLDDLRIFYPQKHFTLETILQGQLPLWNPYSFSGNYHIGLSETGVFYPLSLLFFILPQLPAWILLIIIQPILAGVGMYLFLKKLFKEKQLALFGGLVFGFSGIVVVRMVEGLSVGHTLLWLPFAFWGIESFFQNKKFRYVCILTGSLVFSLLSGWFQFTFYICVFSFVYAVFRMLFFKENKHRFSLLIFLPYIFLPLLTLYHLLPAIQTLLASPRGSFNKSLLAQHLMPPAHLLTLLFPDFWGNPGSYNYFGNSEYKESILYIGVIPFVLSLFSFFSFRKNRFVLFFSIVTVISLLLGIDSIISRWFISLPIPIVSSFLPNRIFLITSFSLSVLSVYGLAFLLSEKVRLYKALLVLGGVLLTIFLTPVGIFRYYWMILYSPLDDNYKVTLHKVLTSTHFLVQEKNLIIPSILAFLFALIILIFYKWRKKSLFVYICIILSFVGQFYFAQKYIPWSSPQFVFPENPVFSYLQQHAGINRFISTREGYISSNMPLYYNLFSPDGVSSMYSERYGELVTYMKSDGRNVTNIPRVETRIDPESINVFIDKDPYLSRFLAIDGVKYIIKLRKEINTKTSNLGNVSGFHIAWQNNTWQIFTNDNALPRFFWSSDYSVLPQNKILPALFSKEFSPRHVILEEKPDMKIETQSTGSITLLSYTPEKVTFAVAAKGNGLLFLSDAYAPQFKVSIDGKNTKLLRADYDFRAVAIPTGQHKVVFYFDQAPETIAFIMSFGVLVIFISASVVLLKKNFLTW